MSAEFIRLILFARYPIAGNAKTRLIPAVGPAGAAKVHKILAQKTVATIGKAAQAVDAAQFILSYTGGDVDQFKNWLNNETGRDNIIYAPQPEGDLTDRLLAMLEPAPVIFFGSDTPDLTLDHVNDAIAALADHDVVIGPALDGGYYLIGMKCAHDMLLRDMPWSTDQVLPTTLARCKDAGLNVHMLGPLSDCDMPEDLARWPWITDMLDQVSL